MKDIEWKYLKGLNELYIAGKTRLKMLNDDFINQVIYNQKKLIKYKTGNHNFLESTPRFSLFYEQHFKETFEYYNSFFEKSGIDNNAHKRYDKSDLESLIFIFNNKEKLKETLTTEYTFSSRVFKRKGAKYLSGKPGLKKDVLKLLDIDEFPEKDPKNNFWRIVVDCINPQVIVICENIACLKVPTVYKKRGVELWYVGGNNTKPLLDLSLEKISHPIFYFCDWDYHGLTIFSRIKEIFNLKGVDVNLLEPKDLCHALPVNSPNHNSKWKREDFSKLKKDDFTRFQTDIIKQLISNDEWVEEESMDLIELLELKSEL
ncbi:Wadjet anti-phage system protein JetD domain-containing protein [Ochrovirga pacifica]|uniref:Wadjet anti-phage system protein JetD domain-containing protein n=1 Tax=Ochrovirga pacifica TaxID=1042376 RepID=UPI000255986F|nr:Wadjet anti-phage system protein JetD domain-containing protein [Ochrovirga pacifica]